jgi:TPR repeat protein
LGRAYQYGYGVDTDSNKAIEYYTLAAELGNLKSHHTLGDIYKRGEITKRNILEALKWYTKAYSQGFDATRSNLFDMYEDTPYENFFDGKLYKILRSIYSTGVPTQIRSEATINSYNKACTRVGYWYYQHGDSKLAWKYFSDSLKNRTYAEAEDFINCKCIDPKDVNNILDNLQTQMELVEGLDGYVLYILGRNYCEGVPEEPTEKKVKRGTEEHGSRGNEDLKTRANVILKQNCSKALFFFEKAAEKGYYGAQYNLGEMYHYGFGVKVDLGRARELYDKAATGNEKYANIIGMLYHCEGELHDISKAVECYEKSGKCVDPIIPGIRYLFGTGVQKDYKKAIEILTSHPQGIHSLFYLGFAYYNGPDDIRDYRRAFRLFQKVVELDPFDRHKMIFGRFKNNSKCETLNEEYSFTIEPDSVFQGEAYYYLGIMYTKGQGTTQNKREAKKCFSKSPQKWKQTSQTIYWMKFFIFLLLCIIIIKSFT